MDETERRNLATARRWLEEVFNAHDVDSVPQIIAPTYRNMGTTTERGVTAGRQVIEQADSWAPDRRIDIKYAASQGDVVMVLFTLSGTHTGVFRGVQPSGRRFSVYLSDVFRFDDAGLMIEGWVIGKEDLKTALENPRDDEGDVLPD